MSSIPTPARAGETSSGAALRRATRYARAIAACTALAAVSSCRRAPGAPGPAIGMVDQRATAETRALFANLRRTAHDHVLFGHQDDLAYGVQWSAEPGRSDVRETAGDYPAVYGWELSGIENAAAANIDYVDFTRMRGWIQEGYRRGGVITMSWHIDNPLTGGNAWDTTSAIASILPGGARHTLYRRSLDRMATFVSRLRGRNRAGNTTTIPVIFRPFHEPNSGAFWWGDRHATPEQYKALWRFTVGYLRDRKGLHNLIWAYSPAGADSLSSDYFDWYPGDEYVDLLGLDEYFSPPGAQRAMESQRDTLASHVRWLTAAGASRGKVSALTETGYLTVPDSSWWTQALLPALRADAGGTHVAYALVWRNAIASPRSDAHFFAPYKGQVSAADFVRFHDDPLTWFERDLPDLYSAP